MRLVARRMTEREEQLVNEQIRKAEKMADEKAPILTGTEEEKAAWDLVYHTAMNTLVEALGLRVLDLTSDFVPKPPEQPLVGLKDVARHLKVKTTAAARNILLEVNAPLIEAYKPTMAVLPSELNLALMKNSARPDLNRP